MATIPGNKPDTLPESKSSNKPRARRRASGLGGELWGDTGAPAFATLDLWGGDNEKVNNITLKLHNTHAKILVATSFKKKVEILPKTTKSKALASRMQRISTPTHLAYTLHPPPRHSNPLLRQPEPLKPPS
jgi:hypothetical protein